MPFMDIDDPDAENHLAHIGVIRKSGRYPWGSGENPNQRNPDFLDIVAKLRKEGLSEKEIADGFGMTTTQLRAAKAIEKNKLKAAQTSQAMMLKDRGMSNVAIGKQMGINESNVRALLDPSAQERNEILMGTADAIKQAVDRDKYVDIGVGTEHGLGISREKMKVAVAVLQEQGYKVQYLKVNQLGTGKQTTVLVLTKDDVPYPELVANAANVKTLGVYSEDGGRTLLGIEPPTPVSSKRIGVRYAEEGGSDADGVIYVRPGVPDVALGVSRYAQVRIAVDGTHYLKGMAMYKDDLPDGVDLLFNTNKSNTGNKLDAMKKLKRDKATDEIDQDNPFGAVVRQIKYTDADGKQRTSPMNIVNEEGNWQDWSKSLSSQMLSKQSVDLAKEQLGITYDVKKAQLDEIAALTNPAVRRKLLQSYSDDVDASAVHLKAAALPRQKTSVILPVNSLKDDEIYAPNFRDGENVMLVRYPHGGIFEIPSLRVNNREPGAKKALGQATDAVGINSKVAKRLSGADFDGDTVLVIPNGRGKVQNSPPLKQLKNFDPQAAYPAYEGMPKMSARSKQKQMGDVSNLITDMTIKGATHAEIARAVKHSMVVIDAEKHNLNWRQSAKDNNITELKRKYQDNANGRGSSTLISRATSPARVLERKPRSAAKGGPIDKATGRLVFEETGASYVNKAGQTVVKTTKTTKLAEASDARKLSSGTPMEAVYADHSNRLKDLANTARKMMVETGNIPQSSSAKRVYAPQVESLGVKLNLALRNAPRERQAQLLANATLAAKKAASPDMEEDEIKRIKGQALTEARNRVGAKKARIILTDLEWEAIQAGAISNNRLEMILDNADLDQVKQLATPRSAKPGLNGAQVTRARNMARNGYTQAEIADALGVSTSTLNDTLRGKDGG